VRVRLPKVPARRGENPDNLQFLAVALTATWNASKILAELDPGESPELLGVERAMTSAKRQVESTWHTAIAMNAVEVQKTLTAMRRAQNTRDQLAEGARD
jgi:hypothetical protein